VLVDLDLRNPKIGEVFDLKTGEHGVTEVLKNIAEIDDVLVSTDRYTDGANWDDEMKQTVADNLSIIPCGRLPHSPGELLISPESTEFLQGLKERFDLVILDNPPCLPVADTSVLAAHLDGVVIIQRDGLHGQLYKDAVKTLKEARANIIGTVINKQRKKSSKSGYEYGYGYAYGYGYGNGRR